MWGEISPIPSIPQQRPNTANSYPHGWGDTYANCVYTNCVSDRLKGRPGPQRCLERHGGEQHDRTRYQPAAHAHNKPSGRCCSNCSPPPPSSPAFSLTPPAGWRVPAAGDRDGSGGCGSPAAVVLNDGHVRLTDVNHKPDVLLYVSRLINKHN